MTSLISSVLTRFSMLSRTLFSCPESTCTTNHWSFPARVCAILERPTQKVDDIHEDEIEKRNVTAKKEHRDNDDEGGIGQLFVALDPLFFRLPRPGSFLQLEPDFVKEIFCSADHRERLNR